jgi:hypothetical protein
MMIEFAARPLAARSNPFQSPLAHESLADAAVGATERKEFSPRTGPILWLVPLNPHAVGVELSRMLSDPIMTKFGEKHRRCSCPPWFSPTRTQPKVRLGML